MTIRRKNGNSSVVAARHCVLKKKLEVMVVEGVVLENVHEAKLHKLSASIGKQDTTKNSYVSSDCV